MPKTFGPWILLLFSLILPTRHGLALTHSLRGLTVVDSIQAQLKPITQEPSFGTFVTSTEMQLSRAQPILEQAPEGLYLTIGSDRGFRAASLSGQTTHLLLMDLSPKLIRYNKINIELFKTPTLEEYKKLRWTSSWEDWVKAHLKLSKEDYDWWEKNVRDLGSYDHYPLPEMLNRFGKDLLVERFLEIRSHLEKLVAQSKKLGKPRSLEHLFFKATYEEWINLSKNGGQTSLLSKKDWEWCRRFAGNGKDYAYAQEWVKDPKSIFDYGKIIDYKSGNYLYRPNLYKRLHQMALEGRITTLLIDLSQEKDVALLGKSLQASGLRLSVLDLDNAYGPYYMGERAYLKVVHEVEKMAEPNSILLVMRNFKEYGSGQFSIYVGFTFENFRQWPGNFGLESFFKHLPKELPDLINGRLFEAGEMPPSQYF